DPRGETDLGSGRRGMAPYGIDCLAFPQRLGQRRAIVWGMAFVGCDHDRAGLTGLTDPPHGRIRRAAAAYDQAWAIFHGPLPAARRASPIRATCDTAAGHADPKIADRGAN